MRAPIVSGVIHAHKFSKIKENIARFLVFVVHNTQGQGRTIIDCSLPPPIRGFATGLCECERVCVAQSQTKRA